MEQTKTASILNGECLVKLRIVYRNLIIRVIFFVTHKNQRKINKQKKTTTQFQSNYYFESSKNPEIYRAKGEVRVRLWVKKGCLKEKVIAMNY